MWRRLAIGTMMLSLAACSAATTRAGDPVESMDTYDVLFAPQLAVVHATTVYDAVAQLRPDFFKRRGTVSFTSMNQTGPQVFLDDVEMGGVESLRTIPLDNVTSVRYLSASEATFRWGSSRPSGAILVSTTR